MLPKNLSNKKFSPFGPTRPTDRPAIVNVYMSEESYYIDSRSIYNLLLS